MWNCGAVVELWWWGSGWGEGIFIRGLPRRAVPAGPIPSPRAAAGAAVRPFRLYKVFWLTTRQGGKNKREKIKLYALNYNKVIAFP